MEGKNQKKMRGQPIDYDELKLRRSLCLTDTAWKALGDKSASLGLSRSEFIERLLRNEINY